MVAPVSFVSGTAPSRVLPPYVRPILLLEMNEIPWRVVDKTLRDGRYPHLQRLFGHARTYTTLTQDTGELSPWVTWPTLHRGLPNTMHGIANLGQDVTTFRGTPLWEEYRTHGLPVGVCGSMQSWPPQDPGPGGFFVPDTFAHDEQCIPAYLAPLQRFNLNLVRKNGLVVRNHGFASTEVARLIPALMRARLQPSTLRQIVEQLFGERRDRSRVARRPIFQTLLFWDVFKSLYRVAHPPALATFFSNHVAGVMHRYWDHVFPEDFPERSATTDHSHAATMDFALSVLDTMVGDALEFVRKRPDLLVVFATSMGQAAIHRQHEGVSLSVTDLGRLLSAFDVPTGAAHHLLAMVPQVAVRIDDKNLRATLRASLERALIANGRALFTVNEVGASLSITIRTPSRLDVERNGFYQHRSDGTSAFIAWENAGISVHELGAGTAYHIPEGVLALYGRGISPADERTEIPATAVKAMLLKLGGLAATDAHEVRRVNEPSNQQR